MYQKTSEYRYQQISNKGGGKNISIIKEIYTPRVENDYTLTTIKTVKSSKKGGECLCNLDNNKLSTNKYSKNYSTYSNIIKDGKNLKCSCFECDHIYGNKNKKCTCGLCGDEKYTKISISNKKKIRGRSVETRNLNKYTSKKCICGEEEKNCKCNQNSKNISKAGSLIKSYTNINSTSSLRKKQCTCSQIYCTCGKDHRSSITKISQTKNIKTTKGSKNCICGKKICTCNQKEDKSKKAYNATNLNIKTITSNTTKKNKDYKSIYSTGNIHKSKEESKIKKIRFSSVDNHRRSKEEKKCLCGLDHSLVRSTEKSYYNSTINQVQCTCGNYYECTCRCICPEHSHYEEDKRNKKLMEDELLRDKEKRRIEDKRRKQLDLEERERRRKMDEEERERRRQLDLERKEIEDERRQLEEEKRKRKDEEIKKRMIEELRIKREYVKKEYEKEEKREREREENKRRQDEEDERRKREEERRRKEEEDRRRKLEAEKRRREREEEIKRKKEED